jgi:hypothetical protein
MSFDPVSLLLTAALTGGGAFLQNRSAQQADQQRAQALRAQRLRNEDFRKKSSAEFASSLDRFQGGRPIDDMDAVKQKLADAFALQAPGGTTAAMPGMKSAAGKEALQTELASGKAKTDARGASLANLRSLGDLLFANNIDRTHGNQRIGANAFNTRSSNVALPHELFAAEQSRSSPLGDLLVAAGMGIGQSNFDSGFNVDLAKLFGPLAPPGALSGNFVP